MSLNGKENINPIKAIIQNDQEPTEMSAEEFKRTLMTWVEDRGLLSDLRAYLRKQLIGVLKDTTLGQKTQKLDMKMSPKSHVMNLLIAEFLLKSKYYYTLSVFSTEVPFFISILPEFTTSVINPNMFKPDGQSEMKNFTHQNYHDILQTLGFFPESRECQKLHELYFRSNEHSLLKCMVHLLSKYSMNQFEPLPECSKDNPKLLESWEKNIYKILSFYHIPSHKIVLILDNMKVLMEQQKLKIKMEEKEKYNLKQVEINKDVENRESEIKRMIAKMEHTYFEEKNKMMADIMKEQGILEKLKQSVMQQKYEYETKNETYAKKIEVIKQQEEEVKDQVEILKTRIKVMQNVYDSVIEENKKISDLRKELQKNDSSPDEIYKKIHNEYIILKNEIESTKGIIENFFKHNSSMVDKEVQTVEITNDVNESEVHLLRGMLDKLQSENASLRILNSEQQRRLDNLVIQNTILVNELETSQSTFHLMNRNNSRRGMITVPPILPPHPLPAVAGIRSVNTHGGGENLGFGPQPVMPNPHRYSFVNNFRNSVRRKDPKRFAMNPHNTIGNVSGNNSSSGSSTSTSPTDDILREARQRLERLEQETEEVERHYQAYRERQSQNRIHTFSFHHTNSPILRVRQSSTRESYPAFAVNLNPPIRRTFFQQPIHHSNPTNFPIGTPHNSNENLRFIPTEYTTRHTISNFLHSIPSTSFNLTSHSLNPEIIEEETPEKDTNGVQPNIHSAAPSASSSRLSQLHNLSISTIEMSSDSENEYNNSNN